MYMCAVILHLPKYIEGNADLKAVLMYMTFQSSSAECLGGAVMGGLAHFSGAMLLYAEQGINTLYVHPWPIALFT